RPAGRSGIAGSLLRPSAQRRPGAGGQPAVRAGARPAPRRPPPASDRALRAHQEGGLPPGPRGPADAPPERADSVGAAPAHLSPAPAHRPLPAQRWPGDTGEEQDRQPRGIPWAVALRALRGEGRRPLPDRGPRPRPAGGPRHGPEERRDVLPP